MCPRHYIDDKEGLMSPTLWCKLINEIISENPQAIILPFWRGESLLHPEFKDMLSYAIAKGLKIHISTNGQILDNECAQILLQTDFVTFSIHTRLGFENAKKFIALRQSNKPTTQVSFVQGEATTQSILSELIKTKDLEGFDSVRLYDEHTKDGVFGKSGLSIKEPRIFCKKLTDTIVIAYNGTVSRCNHIWQTEVILNAYEMTIKEIWQSTYFKGIRDNYPDKYCEPCEQWTGHTCGEAWKNEQGKVVHIKYGPTN